MDTAPAFNRKNIRLPTAIYQGRKSYFLTLCFSGRRRFGTNPRLATWLIANLRKHSAVCAFFVHAYCIMPDHMHVMVTAAGERSNLVKFVQSYKQATAVEFTRRAHRRLWQFKYYDRILRASDSRDRVTWYIWMNPVRAGLCAVPTEFPYLGSFTEIGTKLLKSAAAPVWIPPWKAVAKKDVPR